MDGGIVATDPELGANMKQRESFKERGTPSRLSCAAVRGEAGLVSVSHTRHRWGLHEPLGVSKVLFLESCLALRKTTSILKIKETQGSVIKIK